MSRGCCRASVEALLGKGLTHIDEVRRRCRSKPNEGFFGAKNGEEIRNAGVSRRNRRWWSTPTRVGNRLAKRRWHAKHQETTRPLRALNERRAIAAAACEGCRGQRLITRFYACSTSIAPHDCNDCGW